MNTKACDSSDWESQDIFVVDGTGPAAIFIREGVSAGFLAVVRKKGVDVYRLDQPAQPWKQFSADAHIKFRRLWFDFSGQLLAAGIASSDHVNQGYIYNLADGRQGEYYDHEPTGFYLGDELGTGMGAFTKDGLRLAAASNDPNLIHMMDLQPFRNGDRNLSVIETLNNGNKETFETKALVWSPDEKILAHVGHWLQVTSVFGVAMSGEPQNGVELWKADQDAENKTVYRWLAKIPLSTGPKNKWSAFTTNRKLGAVFTGDGRYLILGSDKEVSDRVRVIDIPGQKVVWESEKQNSTDKCMALSPNGQFLFCGGDDGCVKIWQVNQQDQGIELVLMHTEKLSGEITGLELVPDENSAVVVFYENSRTVVRQFHLPVDVELGRADKLPAWNNQIPEPVSAAVLPAAVETVQAVELAFADQHPVASQAVPGEQPQAVEVLPPASGEPASKPKKTGSGRTCFAWLLVLLGLGLLVVGAFFGLGLLVLPESGDAEQVTTAADAALFGSVCVAPALLGGFVSLAGGIFLFARKKKTAG